MSSAGGLLSSSGGLCWVGGDGEGELWVGLGGDWCWLGGLCQLLEGEGEACRLAAGLWSASLGGGLEDSADRHLVSLGVARCCVLGVAAHW